MSRKQSIIVSVTGIFLVLLILGLFISIIQLFFNNSIKVLTKLTG